jgi:hypothetical protein
MQTEYRTLPTENKRVALSNHLKNLRVLEFSYGFFDGLGFEAGHSFESGELDGARRAIMDAEKSPK